MTRRNVGALIVLLALTVILLFVGSVMARSLYWNGPTTLVDNTVIGSEIVLKYYIRTDEPNGRSSTPDGTGKYYIGEVETTRSWPSDDDIDGLFQGLGHEGQTFTLTITAGYFDNGSVWRESVPSPGLAYTVPFVPGANPESPDALTIH